MTLLSSETLRRQDVAVDGGVAAVGDVVAVSQVSPLAFGLAGNVLRRAVHNGTAYPARPAGVAAGFVEYVGPTTPTDWLNGDTWIETA